MRQTAAKYLDTLAETGFVEKDQGRHSKHDVRRALVRLLRDMSGGQ